MRAVIQRVNNASVEVDGKTVGEIGKGLLVFLGVGDGDTDADLLFNEGWQNNLYITIGAAAINFDAQVYEWAIPTSGGSLEVQ